MENAIATKKIRVSIPPAIKNRVKEEYNQMCAICGKPKPQIHHIDEDPSNNEVLNLIPLCPNCHLIDQHSPTTQIDVGILQLFRKYKDPCILAPQFHSIYKRMKFLSEVEDWESVNLLVSKTQELCDFIVCLEMGTFFSPKIKKILSEKRVTTFVIAPEEYWEREERKRKEAVNDAIYRQSLRDAREEVSELCVELLRFQKWDVNTPAR